MQVAKKVFTLLLPLVARGQVGGALGDAVATTQAVAAAGGARTEDAATNTANNAATNAAAAANDARLAGTSRAAANAAGGAAAAVATVENADHGLSWGHAAIGVLRRTLDAIVFGCKGGEIGLIRNRGSTSWSGPTHPESVAGRGWPPLRSCT